MNILTPHEPTSQKAKVFSIGDYRITVVNQTLSKTLVSNRFAVKDFISMGSNGQVLSVTDALKMSEPLAMKVLTSVDLFDQELKSLLKISEVAQRMRSCRQAKSPFPHIVDSGLLFLPEERAESDLEDSLVDYPRRKDQRRAVMDLRQIGKLNPYYIVPRYTCSLKKYFEKNQKKLSVMSVLDLGCRLVEQLQVVHQAGYVYNDLKPDNIMLDKNPQRSKSFSSSGNRSFIESCSTNAPSLGVWKESGKSSSSFKDVNFFLIDFGACTAYRDEASGRLLIQRQVQRFKGNLMCSSIDQLNFQSTGRKDDLLALCYMLVYLINRGDFFTETDCEKFQEMDQLSRMQWTLREKEGLTPKKLCEGRAVSLLPFVEKVFKIGFFDEPQYDQLISILEKQAWTLCPKTSSSKPARLSIPVTLTGPKLEGPEFAFLAKRYPEKLFDVEEGDSINALPSTKKAKKNPSSRYGEGQVHGLRTTLHHRGLSASETYSRQAARTLTNVQSKKGLSIYSMSSIGKMTQQF